MLKYINNDALILIVERITDIEEKWAPILRQLPKGICEPGETLEKTAIREVLEETGYVCRIISKSGKLEWSYLREHKLWNKTVHYYFMETLTPIAKTHDEEFDFVRWVKIEDAVKILSYPQERELIAEVIEKKILSSIG